MNNKTYGSRPASRGYVNADGTISRPKKRSGPPPSNAPQHKARAVYGAPSRPPAPASRPMPPARRTVSTVPRQNVQMPPRTGQPRAGSRPATNQAQKRPPSRGSARYKSETYSRLGEALAGFIRRTASKERLPILSDTTDSGGRRNCSERDNGEKQFARRYCVRKNCAERDWQLRYGASYCAFSSYFYWFAPLLPGVISLFIMENLRKNMVR